MRIEGNNHPRRTTLVDEVARCFWVERARHAVPLPKGRIT